MKTNHLLLASIAFSMTFLSLKSASAAVLYVSNSFSNSISEIADDGTSSIFATGVNNPQGLAFNSLGDLYVAAGSDIDKITPDGKVSIFASGLNFPEGLAFDSAGNLFVSDYGTNTITKIAPDGTSSTFATGVDGPTGLAFNSAGDLFVGCSSSTIAEIASNGTVSIYATNIAYPWGLSFDPSGNLYVANNLQSTFTSGTITKITPDGRVSEFASGLGLPRFLECDSAGDLFATDLEHINVYSPDGSLLNSFQQSPFLTGLAFGPASVPEPSAYFLLALGLLILLIASKRRLH